ncbi:helix-turn-helix transcriptional regulator [Marinobacterium arenosum]|uniref:helix-turn-helix transcriptional regulator n=1 Tax=Marinobacterium arenosum TaxID=2862496 RepID=UPI001C949927|nr:helix-turn-helix transcriptional regulator [Marinobacterium arenosum]MBY4678182.1 helix-turn-helix transcriptional regulator [Marinobacterium arenosum]
MSAGQSQFDKWNQAVGELFGHLADTDFPRYLVAAINQVVEVEAVMLVLERRNETPVLLYDLGIPEDRRKIHIDTYFSGAYLLDPFCLAVSEGLAPGFYHLSEVAPDDFYQSDYYRTYYKEASLLDDAYFVVEPKDGIKFSFAVGRQGDHPPFSAEELALLRQMNPVVQGASRQYWQHVLEAQALPQDAPPGMRAQVEAAFNNFGSSVLTEREREVALLLLRGHSSKSAAQKLGISPDTVQMHRKNMYAKLDLSSQSELFSLFIAALSYAGGRLDEDPLAAYMQQG